MQLDLGHLDTLGVLAGDQDLLRIPALGVRGTVTVNLGERWREVDGGVGARLDQLNILPTTAAYKLMER